MEACLRSLSGLYPKGRRRSPEARLKLIAAYRNTFGGNPTREEAGLVLNDIAQTSGFYQVMPAGTSDTDRAFADGSRWLMAHIFKFLRMTETEIAALEAAAREEAITSLLEGNT